MGFSIPSKSHNRFLYLKLKVSSPKITFEAHAQISLELQHPPANPWAFNWRPCPGSEEFERGPLWQEI